MNGLQGMELSCWGSFSKPKWSPQPTVQSMKTLLFAIGIFMVVSAGAMIILNRNVHEIKIENYDSHCSTSQCALSFTLDEPLTGPVYVFYELDNFYQNHRRYIKSKSSAQLAGNKITLKDATAACSPVVKNSDLKTRFSITGQPLSPSGIATPCGLIAASYFTDSFQIFQGVKEYKISPKGIAWPHDIGNKFHLDQAQKDKYWINVEDERFIVWMRTASLPHFRKPWGIIHMYMPKGNYQAVISNVYEVSAFQGHKSLILSTNGLLGGKNNFLAYAIASIGSVLIIIGIVFHMKQKNTNDKFGKVIYIE